jgi:hypothetical protein
MPAGGHFTALEEVERLVEDIRAFLRPLRRPSRGTTPQHGVIWALIGA